MTQSYSRCIVHIVTAAKNRNDLIPTDVLPQLHAYVAALCRDNDSVAYRVGGIENHIHIACTLPRTIAPALFVRRVKAYSSKWMKQFNRDFWWQDGYGLFSISPAHLPLLIRYIDNQREHHAIHSFDSEVERIEHRYGIDRGLAKVHFPEGLAPGAGGSSNRSSGCTRFHT